MGYKPKTLFFYLNDELHKQLGINRGRDLFYAWNFPRGQRMTYTYSDVVKRKQPALTTKQVADMMGRSKKTLELALRVGAVEKPQFAYTLDQNRKKSKYLWSEKDILDLLEYLSSIHRGRPRNDGLITPAHLPTPREVKAMLHDDNVLYVKQGDTFIPSWRAKDI